MARNRVVLGQSYFFYKFLSCSAYGLLVNVATKCLAYEILTRSFRIYSIYAAASNLCFGLTNYQRSRDTNVMTRDLGSLYPSFDNHDFLLLTISCAATILTS